jgi:3-hydroxyisobutyrate dehydrogenase
MKLAANLLRVGFWQALGESLSLASPPGMDPARAVDLLADSNIGAGILRARGAQIVAAMKGDSDHAPAAFDVDTMLKDLRYMSDEAAAQGRSLPLASRTLECFDRASRDGGGGVDGADYPAYWVAHQRAAAALNGFVRNPPQAG